MRRQVGVIAFGAGIDIRAWYADASRKHIAVWSDNCILLYERL